MRDYIWDAVDERNAERERLVIPLSELDIMTEAEAKGTGGRWCVFALWRYPRAEYDRVRGQIEAGKALNVVWRDAKAALNQRLYGRAGDLLTRAIAGHAEAIGAVFTVPEAQWLLARVRLEEGRVLAARRLLREVVASDEPPWSGRADQSFFC